MQRILLPVLVFGCLAAGCRPSGNTVDTGTPDLRARLEAQEQRLAQLEAETAALKAKLEAAGRSAAAQSGVAAQKQTNTPPGIQAQVSAQNLQAQVDALVSARMNTLVSSEVARQVDGRLGSEREMDTIFRQAVDEQMTAYEKRQQEAREEQRRKQAEEWEKRRAEAEKQQWDKIRTDLALSDTQAAQLKEVSQQARQTIRDTFRTLREQGTATPEQIQQQASAFKASYEASLQQVLTAEQLEAYRNQPRNLLRMIDMMAGGGHFGRHFGDSTGP